MGQNAVSMLLPMTFATSFQAESCLGCIAKNLVECLAIVLF